MAKSKPQTKTSKTKVANNYRHPESESLMRPDVGTQAQFKRKLPPKKYRYDDSLSPLLEWDEKGLKHWMEGHKNPERYGDVITDVYEALEALVKLVTERDADLSANREKFASVLGLPEAYKKMLKEYIDFGCEYRHSPETSKPRVYPSERDTEAFIYLTGVFLRLGVQTK